MNFKNNDPIYLQITEYINEKILLNIWLADSKVPSVRDLAIELQVNPNTVMRSYEYLQNKSIIYNKRGIGFFVSPEAMKQIKDDKKERFLKEELPLLFKNMSLLDLSINDLIGHFEQFNQEKTHEK